MRPQRYHIGEKVGESRIQPKGEPIKDGGGWWYAVDEAEKVFKSLEASLAESEKARQEAEFKLELHETMDNIPHGDIGKEFIALQEENKKLKKWKYLTQNHAPYEAAGATWGQRHEEDQIKIAALQEENVRQSARTAKVHAVIELSHVIAHQFGPAVDNGELDVTSALGRMVKAVRALNKSGEFGANCDKWHGE